MERRRATLCDHIETWRSVQTLYMPGVTQLCQINSTRTDTMPTEQDSEMPESIQLWLLSSVPPGLRETGCVDGLVEKEHRLRLAEADDALVALRRQLRITTVYSTIRKLMSRGLAKSPTLAHVHCFRSSQPRRKCSPIAIELHEKLSASLIPAETGNADSSPSVQRTFVGPRG